MSNSQSLGSPLLFGALAALAGWVSHAEAAAPSAATPDTLPDVTVTASRQKTSLQKTPASITAISRSELDQLGVHTVSDLAGLAPNVTLPRVGVTPSSQTFFIRGIGTVDPLQEAAVGVYIDDVYIARPIVSGALIDLPDLERVEVLRGPQGTLFGRNSSAGAVRYVTKDPGNEVHTLFDTGVGNYGAFQTHAYVAAPVINDRLYASLAFTHNQRDGTSYDPVIDRDVNDIDINAARAKIRLTPNDRVDAVLSIDGALDDSSGPYRTPLSQPGGGFNPNESFSPLIPYNKLKSGGASLTASWHLDEHLTLKSITAARSFSWNYVSDNVGAANFASGTSADVYDTNYSQEFQAQGHYGRLDFTSGLFLYDERFSVFRTSSAQYIPSINTQNLTGIQSFAGYAQASYKILPTVKLTLGLRYSYDETSFKDGNYNVINNGSPNIVNAFTVTSPIFISEAHHNWTKATPHVGVEWQATPDALLYVSYGQGYKAGGFDNRSANYTVAQTPYQPETVDTYEVGAKTRWFGGKLTLNGALFYNDYSNFQSTVYLTPYVSALVNAGHAHTYGFDAEARARLLPGLEWRGAAGYVYSVYDDFDNATSSGVSASGKRLPYAPRWTLNSAISWVVPLNIPGVVRVGADVQFQSQAYNDVLNTPQAAIPAQAFVNASLGYTTENGIWSAQLNVRNLADSRYNQSGLYSPPVSYFLESAPRTVLFTLRRAL